MKQTTSMMNAILGMMRRSVAFKNNNMVLANELPADAKSFILRNFPSQAITYAEKNNSGFEVSLNDGTEVTFSNEGAWGKVERKVAPVPTSLLPETITSNVKELFSDALVVSADKTGKAYSILLSNGVSLKYDMEGHLA